MSNLNKKKRVYHVIRGVGRPPITQESVTVSLNPITMLLRASRMVGGSDADNFEILIYGIFGDGSLDPASLTAVTRKVYSLSTVKFVSLYVISVIVSVILLHLRNHIILLQSVQIVKTWLNIYNSSLSNS